MGLKRRSRFAFAACLLGANAPDIDVFAPLAFPVDGIEFHRGPLHGVFAWPLRPAAPRSPRLPPALPPAAVLALPLWRGPGWGGGDPDALPFRAGPLFVVT